VPYELTQHAREVLAKRRIPVAWMERAINHPGRIESDPKKPDTESRWTTIPEHGNRVLRVVVNKRFAPERIVTVYFDRTMKGQL
jgi:hypothetical protein